MTTLSEFVLFFSKKERHVVWREIRVEKSVLSTNTTLSRLLFSVVCGFEPVEANNIEMFHVV